MATTYGTRIRFVRCPKCHRVLLEVSDAPVYKCGGCDTILKAKYYNAVEEKNAIPEPAESNMKNLAQSNKPISETETISLPPNIANRTEQERVLSSILHSQEIDPHESSNISENSIEDGGINSAVRETPAKSRQHSYDEPEKSFKANLDVDIGNNWNRASATGSEASPNGTREHDFEDSDRNDMQKCALLNVRSRSDSMTGNSSRRLASLRSDAFHSVNSWMESEEDMQSGPLSISYQKKKNIHSKEFRNLKYEQTEALRLVDQLKYHINGLFKQTEMVRRRRAITNYTYKQKLRSTESLHSSLVNHPSQHCACHDCYHICHLQERACRYQIAAKQHREGEIRQRAKHHCLPALGGAPFIICYKCLTLLQLPMSFLVSAKPMHVLQCGACSSVLTYLFRTRHYRTTETPLGAPHPPSEVSSSEFNACRAYVGPVSFNDDGPSLEKSYSMEAKAHSLNALGVSSESEKDRPKKIEHRSSLHRLMGYPSARELLSKHIDE